MGLLTRLTRTLGRTRAFAWVGSRVLHRLDRRAPVTARFGFPLLYLTATGRRSGEPRTTPLLYARDGDALVVVASNWGRRSHPAWALNLDASPHAVVRVDGEERAVRARRASEQERARLWPRVVEVWPGYDGYRARAGREIRLYVLEPPSDGARRGGAR